MKAKFIGQGRKEKAYAGNTEIVHVTATEFADMTGDQYQGNTCGACALRLKRGGPCCLNPDANKCGLPQRQENGLYLAKDACQRMVKRYAKALRRVERAQAAMAVARKANVEELGLRARKCR